jgi:hypothetical protein
MGETTILDFFKNKKINYSLILMIVFLLFGFYLRAYHIDYPVIGYHNWKSAHYLTEARNFANRGFFQEGFFVPMRDTMNNINEPASGAHNDTFPLDPIVIAVLFRIFGESIRLARLVEIFFSLGAAFLFYLFIKELFDNENLALLCGFLAVINPMYVFFSHNIQLVNSALFFMLLGLYFYARWLKQIKKPTYLYLAVLFIAISAMAKYTFAVIAIPILFSFPYKKFFKQKNHKIVLDIAVIIALIFPAWMFYVEKIVKQRTIGHLLTSESAIKGYGFGSLVDFTMIGNRDFWNILRHYAADNFTLLGVFLAMFGCIFLSYIFFLKNNKTDKYRFMFGYFFSIFVFLFVMGFKLSGHNYHQFPIAPFILFAIAFLAEFISENLKSVVGSKEAKPLIFVIVSIIFIALLWGPSQASRDRMFNTQFPGLDIAGNYINHNKLPGDRVMHSSGQSYGFLWHTGGTPSYKGPGTIEHFQNAVDEFNVSWVFVYQWGIQNYMQDPVIYEYLKENFRLVQFAFTLNNNQASPIYFLFRKGGTFDESKLNEALSTKPMIRTQYHKTSGPYEIYHINLE